MKRLAQPPIVVNEGNDVILFDSIERAEQSIEASDVTHNVYHIFDSNGAQLTPHGLGDRTGTVRLELTDSSDPARLRQMLAEFVVARRKASRGKAAEMSIPDLLALIPRRS